MKLRIRQLRMMISEALHEGGGGVSHKPQPYSGNAMSPASADREQMSYLADKDIDTDDGEDVSMHLRDQTVDPEDCFGPVPPTAPNPYAQQDPFVRDSSPLPSSGIARG